MRIKHYSIFFLFVALGLGMGCSKKGGETQLDTNFVFGASTLVDSSHYSGGLMIYGTSDIGQSFSIAYSSGEELTLGNGNWNFYAIGWDGYNGSTYGHPMVGTAHCGKVKGVSLSGGDEELTFTMSEGNCLDKVFGPLASKNANGSPKPVSFYSCHNEDAIIVKDPGACEESVVDSYKVVMMNRSIDGVQGEGIISKCVDDVTAGNPVQGGDVRVPLLAIPGIGTPLKIISYDDTGCSGTSKSVRVNGGLLVGRPPYVSAVADDGAHTEVYMNNDVCDFPEGNGATPHGLPSGDSIVCNSTQMTNFTSTGQYILGQDIDFEGQEFLNTSIAPITFKGWLNGRGHTVRNFTLTRNDGGQIGVFDSMSEGLVEDIKFQNVTVNMDSSNYGGVIAGRVGVTMTDNPGFEDIIFEDITFNLTDGGATNQYYGAVAGEVANSEGGTFTDLWGISLKNITVNVNSDNLASIGGVVGYLNGNGGTSAMISLHRILIDGFTINQPSFTVGGSSLTRVGGVIGDMSTSGGVELRDVTVKGIQFGTASEPLEADAVGGIAGHFVRKNNAHAEKVSTEGEMVIAKDSINGVGGLVGWNSGGEFYDAVSSVDIDAVGQVGGVFGVTEFAVDNQTVSHNNLRYSGELSCEYNCGGIVGLIRDGVSPTTGSYYYLDNVVSQPLSITDKSTDSTGAIGGFVGKVGGSGNSAFNQSKSTFFSVISSDDPAVGGAWGHVGANIASSLGDAHIIFDDVQGTSGSVGGFVGKNESANTLINNSLVDGAATTGAFNAFVGDETNAIDFSNVGASFTNQTPALGGTNTNVNLGLADVTFSNINAKGIINAIKWRDNGWQPANLEFYELFSGLGLSNVGSSTDPFVITSVGQWNTIGDEPKFMDKSFKLGADLDFSTAGMFVPIGSTTNCFHGRFLGNNKTLSNITKSESGAGQPLGVFRSLCSDTIDYYGAEVMHQDPFNTRNHFKLYIKNSYFESDQSVGALAGVVDDDGADPSLRIEISDVHVSDTTVVGNAPTGTLSLGGVIGEGIFDHPESRFTHSSFQGIVDDSNTLDYTGVGGVIGSLAGVAGQIRHLKSSGSVTSSTSTNVGGVIGKHDSSAAASSLRNYSDVSGEAYVGGLVGYANSSAQIYESASRFALIEGNQYIGGAIGGGDTFSAASLYSEADVSGNDFVGGLIGDVTVNTTINNSYTNAAFLEESSTGTPSDLIGVGPGFATISNTFYSGEDGDEGYSGANYVNEFQLREPSIVGPLNNGSVSFVLYPGEVPRMWYEIFPQYIRRGP